MNDAYLSDLLDQVVTVEPLPAWGDVLGRARRTRRRYALVAAALATLVLAPSSWAVVRAFEGTPPPEQITAEVASMNKFAPQALANAEANGWPDPQQYGVTADLSKLHGVLQAQTPNGPLDLFAAPSSNGGVCGFLAFDVALQGEWGGGWGGGCLNPPLRLSPPGLESESDYPHLSVEYGYTSIPSAAKATMSLTDGQSATVPVVEGWFLTTWHITQACVFSTTTTIQDAGGNQLAGYTAPPAPADWCASGSGAGGVPASDGLRICGPASSVAVASPVVQSVPTKYEAGLRAAAPARPQSFYKIQLNVSDSCSVSFPDAPVAFYVPGASEVRVMNARRTGAFWVHLPRRVNNFLRQATPVAAFHAPTTLAFASVDDQSVAEPSTYLRLFTGGRPVRHAPRVGGWLRIVLEGPSSPWSDGWSDLWISRRANYLRRDRQLVRIPASIAERIRRGDPLPR